ncbi:hypothetical protein EV586_10488 [Tumebacillus sp. BK434]|uniref:hypothetical protein n=1 Tax=Tumebacillus sp. BK434 TaxID=2512169 RepID=UPI0010486078|nr:hypothetical protein [Tumebacillus sp. BK434]TCP54470.1 hypothetical protein EV586_10488 [Tumebacillus sp. BK434]
MKQFAAGVLAVALASALLTGCSNNNAQNDGKPDNGGAKAQSQQAQTKQGQPKLKQNVLSTQDSQKGLYEDKKLEAALKNVQNVKHATVMVAGTTAYVLVEDMGSMKKSNVGGPNSDPNILNAPEATNLSPTMTTAIRDTIIRTNPNLRRVVFLNK